MEEFTDCHVSQDYNPDKLSRAVIAQGADADQCAMLWWVGYSLALEIENSGCTSPIDLNIVIEEPGIWIWEGEFIYTNGPDPDVTTVGTFRVPTSEEWADIREGIAPWEAEDWMAVQQSHRELLKQKIEDILQGWGSVAAR